MSPLVKGQNRGYFHTIIGGPNSVEKGGNMAVISKIICTSSIYRNCTCWHNFHFFFGNICDFHIFYFHVPGNCNKRSYFCLKTIFAVFTLTFILSVIQNFVTGELIHDQPFMSCVLGASFCGAGIGVAFSANGSTGGTDIIAAIINKYRDITLGRVILICDVIIISSSYLVLHNWEKVVYGYVVLFISSFVLDQVVNSARQSVQFFIISSKYEEIGARINKDLHRGVTFIDGVGCYTHNGVKMMFVLAKKRESNTIFRLIKDIDPKAFVSQSAVIGVFGEGFDRIKVK